MLVTAALATTGYSFYGLFHVVKPYFFETGSNQKPFVCKGFSRLLEDTNQQFVDADTKAAIGSWLELVGYSEKYLGGIVTNYQIQGLAAEDEQKVIDSIKTFNRLDWKMMVLFASPQMDPFGNDLPERFSTIRSVARFLAAYQKHFKDRLPEEDSSFIFGSMLKIARMTDLTSPFLIGKMISIAVDGIAMRSVNGLIASSSLLPQEASACYADLKMSLAQDRPMQCALNSEFMFFKHAYARFYISAPLALWLLEKIYGDPEKEYEQLTRRVFEAVDPAPVFKAIRHPLVMLSFPNFRLAWKKYERRLAEKSIVLSELSQIAGELQISIDPYNGELLKTLQKDGKTVFYSVGPDKIDAQLNGDDVVPE